MTLALTYAIFAALATLVNIGVQDVAVRLYQGPYSLLLSVLAGTLAGLLVKYLLDKRYIFGFQTHGLSHEGYTFLRYAAVGVATTLVFLGFEFSFHLAFGTPQMRYLGATIGLALGYFAKYHLDKKYVFKSVSQSI